MMNKVRFTEKLLWLYIILLPLREGVPRLPLLNQKLQYADLIFVILFIALMINYIKGKFHLKWNWFDFSVLLLLLAYLPSFYNSNNYPTSIIELIGLIYLAFLYFVVKNIIDRKEKFISLTKIWIITSVVVSLMGMAALAVYFVTGQITATPFLQYTQVESSYGMFPRLESVFRNPNMYASYMLVSIVFGFILLHYNFENKRARSLIISALAIMFLGVFFSFSRQQIGIYLSSWLILSKFKKHWILPLFRRLAIFAFMILLIFGFLTTIWTIVPVNFNNGIGEGLFMPEINSKYSWHFFTYPVAINMIKSHPFIGIGLGNYGDNFTKYVDWEKAESSYGLILPGFEKSIKERRFVLDPLSTYLGSFAETGLVGFSALLILLLSFLRSLFRCCKNSSSNFKQSLSWFILSGFFGFLINGLIIELLTLRHFWIIVAMGIALIQLTDKEMIRIKEGGQSQTWK